MNSWKWEIEDCFRYHEVERAKSEKSLDDSGLVLRFQIEGFEWTRVLPLALAILELTAAVDTEITGNPRILNYIKDTAMTGKCTMTENHRSNL